MTEKALKINSLADIEVGGKTVLTRLDINSPIDSATLRIKNENRLNMSLPTLRTLKEREAKIAIMAHQGDSLDYQNLIPLAEHAEKLTEKLGWKVSYVDDPCGPAAQAAVKALAPGEAVLLGNLRYLAEEISTFENAVKLAPAQMASTWLVRSLAPLAQAYVNDAFSAAHRSSPSMVAFQEILPSAAGHLFFEEVSALDKVMRGPKRPCVFLLGGAKISDAFGMLGEVLANGSADAILTGGVTANVFLVASGVDLGEANAKFLKDFGLEGFIAEARGHLERHGDKIVLPKDLAFEMSGARAEAPVSPAMESRLYQDLGSQTIEAYKAVIASAGTVFVNGPSGRYETPIFSLSTRELWAALAESKAYTVIGGGDTVTAAQSLIDTSRLDMVCTAGGALVQYLSGKKLPLIEAMKRAWRPKA
jgi:phosphoglycerate kinase